MRSVAGLMKYNDSRKLTIQDMKKLAESKGGKCLSTEYKNLFSKLKWQCSKGHIWEAIPSNVKHHNKWCPHCSKNARFTIDDARKIARWRVFIRKLQKHAHKNGMEMCKRSHMES